MRRALCTIALMLSGCSAPTEAKLKKLFGNQRLEALEARVKELEAREWVISDKDLGEIGYANRDDGSGWDSGYRGISVGRKARVNRFQ